MSRNKLRVGERAAHEIAHGVFLAQHSAEHIWGWGTPAGRIRAQRRGMLIANGAGLRSGMFALEIGCGTGLFTEMFVPSGATIQAVDISVKLIEQARRRNLPPQQITFLAKRFEDCIGEGHFDAIIGSSILHHLDLDEALPCLYALLKPGGVISFAEPNMLNPQIFIQKKVPWIKVWVGDSPDETAINRWHFAQMLTAAGFASISIRPFDWLHPATPVPLIPMVRRIGQWLEVMPIAYEFAGSVYIRARKRVAP